MDWDNDSSNDPGMIRIMSEVSKNHSDIAFRAVAGSARAPAPGGDNDSENDSNNDSDISQWWAAMMTRKTTRVMTRILRSGWIGSGTSSGRR